MVLVLRTQQYETGSHEVFVNYESNNARIQWGDRGPDPLAEKSQNIVFCNTCPDPLKNHKANKPAFNVGPSSARKRADQGPLIVVFGSVLHS